MKTTYMIVDSNNNVVWYYTRLKDAKQDLIEDNSLSIVMMRGPYFAEGFHKYRMRYENGKFIKEKA